MHTRLRRPVLGDVLNGTRATFAEPIRKEALAKILAAAKSHESHLIEFRNKPAGGGVYGTMHDFSPTA
jgi:hypothetical protein